MEESMIRQRFKEALGDVKAPSDLVERMAIRAGAIEDGRKAERELAELADAPAAPGILARAVVGRLMLTQPVPKGVGVKTMVSQLEHNEGFARLSGDVASKLLGDLQTGRLIRHLGEKKPATPQAEAPKTRQMPEIKGPTV